MIDTQQLNHFTQGAKTPSNPAVISSRISTEKITLPSKKPKKPKIFPRYFPFFVRLFSPRIAMNIHVIL